MEPKSLNENIAYLMGHATHLMSLQVSRLFREKKYPVTVEQFTILTVLWYENGLPQKSIAECLHRDKTTITRVIDNMVKENLVVRVPSENDNRIKLIFLTHKGRSLENELVMALALLDAIQRIIDGQEVSDFELSFPVVRAVWEKVDNERIELSN